MKRDYKSFIVNVLRTIIALTFIFSGFTKAVDPWGNAIKLGEYFSAFSLDWLSGSEYFLSVAMSTLEMTLGFAMLFNIGRRTTYGLMFLAMIFFTAITLFLAIANPISDCGCFGDAVKLTNWQTFYKNVALLLFASVVWRFNRYRNYKPAIGMIDGSMLFLFTLFGVGISVYGLRYLPVIDFLPFKVGTHIPSAMSVGRGAEVTTVLIYKNLESGENQEFSLADTTWYDSQKWEFVDRYFIEQSKSEDAKIKDFAIFNASQDYTGILLADRRETFIVTMTTLEGADNQCLERLGKALDYASEHDAQIIGVTTSRLPMSGNVPVGSHLVRFYNIDGVSLKSLIRAKQGLVIVKEGTILAKWSCRGVPDFDKSGDGNTIALLAKMGVKSNLRWMLGVFAVVLTMLYVGYKAVGRRNKNR